MGSRQQLQDLLEAICEKVYFEPPADVGMEYPAIVYERARADTRFADNKPYTITKQYQLKLIARDPDEAKWNAIAALKSVVHDRFYVADNLNHDVFTIYF
jgi:hypothetical protein